MPTPLLRHRPMLIASVRPALRAGALALLAGCATMQPGALSPINARVTNEVVAADAATLAGWTRRVEAMRASPANTVPRRAYLAARAGAWVAFARDAYAVDPRDGTADRALSEALLLVQALDAKVLPASIETTGSRPASPRADLWAALDTMRTTPVFATSPASFADAEVALTLASYLTASRARPASTTSRAGADAERRCSLEQQLATAERVVSELRGISSHVAVAVAAAHAPSVVLAGKPGPVVAIVKAPIVPKVPIVEVRAPVTPKPVVVEARPAVPPKPAVTEARVPWVPETTVAETPMRLIVHFALGSAALTPESRTALDQVATALTAHPGLRIKLETYAERRGNGTSDQELAARRADVVRHYFADANLAPERVTIATTDAGASANDRRVTLAFIGADGRTLNVGGAALPESTVDDLRLDPDPRASAATRARDGVVKRDVPKPAVP
jgi:outer membrane protein OmpA-like peptidoglycan-associated protein